jgi:prevent-host-death family protein
MDVGIRELKARLSEFIGRAADGEDIVVTDRGRPVAQLTSLSTPDALERGIEQGWIEPARRTHLEPVDRVVATRTSLDVLDEDRG